MRHEPMYLSICFHEEHDRAADTSFLLHFIHVNRVGIDHRKGVPVLGPGHKHLQFDLLPLSHAYAR